MYCVREEGEEDEEVAAVAIPSATFDGEAPNSFRRFPEWFKLLAWSQPGELPAMRPADEEILHGSLTTNMVTNRIRPE